MSIEIYTDGPLVGQASVTILLSAKAVEWLTYASNEMARPIEELVEDSVEEAALDYAKSHRLLEVWKS